MIPPIRCQPLKGNFVKILFTKWKITTQRKFCLLFWSHLAEQTELHNGTLLKIDLYTAFLEKC